MKQEKAKKSKLWLWILIGVLALAVVAGGVLALVLGLFGDKGPSGPVGGRPDLYWNIDKVLYTQNSESGLSTREPGEDGLYHVRFAYNGEQVELSVVDKQLVNFIDTMEAMGVSINSDGVVVDVFAPEDFMTPVAINAYVQQVMSDKIIANSSIAMNGMQYTIELSDLTQIYNVSDSANVVGERIEASDFRAMDSIWVYANDMDENTHIYMTGHPVESPVFWRAYQMWNSSEKSTSRVPDENGVYSIDFCSEGGIVTLKCKDKSIVTSIDNKSPHSCHFGFVFDEEGYIIDIMNSGVGIRGAVAAERIEVTELDGAYFSGTQLIPSDSGLSYSANLPEGCVIYDASSGAMRNGVQGQQVDSLQLGDRICVWTDSTGTPVLVYIANRLQDVPAYFNLVRMYDGTKKETKRERVNGYFEFEMVETGKIGKKILRTSDKELASFIDSIANRVVGLKVENGIILNAYTDDDIFGWSSVYGGYIPQIQGTIVSMVSFSKPDSPTNVLLGADYKVYDVSGKDVPYGTEATLRVGDIATVTRDVSCNGVVVYITRRMVGGNNVYYNLDYQYNSTTKQTKRVPDEDGWYYFTMAHKGKQVEVKTNNKEFADLIDKSPNGDLVVVMRVENGIVKEVYDTQAAYGQLLYSGYRISAINGDGTFNVVASSGKEYTIKIGDDCVMYNVSTVYDDHRGERTYSLRVGDMVTTMADYRGYAKLIFVRQRGVDHMYVNKQQLYDATNKVTLREPDAEGWYWFELAVNGELKWFKTNDKELATKIDAYATPFGLRVKDDLILNVTGPNYVKGVYKAGINGWDVTSVSGSSVTVKLNKPGYTDTGKTKTLSVGSGVKVFDISPTAKNFGEAVKLQKGDQIRVYLSRDDNCVYVYVLFHETREKGSVAYCEHCEQKVTWLPWAGANWDGVDCHYYLAGDITITKQTSVGNSTKDYEVVLDLNGKKLEVIGARAFLAYRGDTLSILDSVGGGSVAATGIEGGVGGTILVNGDGKLNLYSGTLSFIDSDIHVYRGSVMSVSSGTFNMYGGTVKGGIVNSPTKDVMGGNIFMQNAVMNIYGGVIEEGIAERTNGLQPAVAAQGGNIYAGRSSVINLYDGEIRNGYSNQHGGNVFLSTATLNVLGGKIYGGECVSAGGNIYNQFAGVLNVEAGTINNGKAGSLGNNVYGSHDTGVFTLSGGEITGDMSIAKAASISISGSPKVTLGAKSGLAIPTSVKMNVGELTKGAEVYINAAGVFTEANTNAQAYVDKGYVKAAVPRTSIRVENNVMIMEGEVSYCEHCGESVEWMEWTGVSAPASGHYFIASDFHQAGQLSINAETDVVLDLYGNSYTSEKIRNFLVRGVLSIMDTVGGGEMVTTGGEEFAGSIALVAPASATGPQAGFNLYSGTLRLADGHPIFKNGGLVRISGNTVMNVYGGTMIGGYVEQCGGCIEANSTSSVINIYGGLITGGTAGLSGDCIQAYGPFNMEGGVVEGEVRVESTSRSVAVSGDAKIENLNLASGIKADVSGLTEGAKIGVTADGIFTQALTNPADYLQYFEAVDEYSDVKVYGDALQVTFGQALLDKVNSIHEKAEQMTDSGVFAAGGTVTATCPVCEEEVQWIELNKVEGTKITEAAHYYLSSDMNIDAHFSVNADICLHLNGHNITSSARAFYIEYVTANFMGKGNVSGAPNMGKYGWNGVLDVPATVHLYGGNYFATNDGPAISGRSNRADTIFLYDGATITRTDGKGLGIRLYDEHDFTMYGGKISGAATNVLLNSGASLSRTVTLNMYGGTIENGTAAQGGNIMADGGSVSINVYGGKIVDGDVYVADNVLGVLISGTPEISELDLTSGNKATLFDLNDGAKIAVNANGAFTVENDKAKAYLDAGYIVAAVAGTNIYEENGVLFMEKETAYCEHCKENVVWTEWPNVSSPVSGHYFLADSVTQTKQFSIVADTDVVLDLNGKTYSIEGVRGYLVRGKFSIVDSVGTGVMTTTGNTTENAHGGLAYIQNTSNDITGACMNLYGGTLTMSSNHAVTNRGGLIMMTTGAVMNMYGGSIVGGEASEYGANVSVGSANSTFNMFGGKISGGKAPVGGDVFVLGTFNMTGGTVEGSVAVDATATDAKFANAVKVGSLNIAEGKLVDVSGLTAGAEIGVVADGVFTKTLTDAASYLPYFVKLKPNDTYEVVDNAIALIVVNELDRLNAIHTKAAKMTADDVFAAGGTVTAVCPVCEKEVEWTELNKVAAPKSIKTAGHYYLSEDVQNTVHYGFYADACVHLNGKNITSSERAFYVDATSTTLATLNIMGEGTVTGYGVDHASIPRGVLDIGGSINVFGGSYVSTGQNPCLTGRGYIGRSVANIYEGATFTAPNESILARSQAVNIYGGTFNAGTVKAYGASTCELNIYGGVIKNTNEDQVAVLASGQKGSVTISGGTIESVSATADVKALTISGTPVIANLDLTSGKKITLGEMELGAKVYVTAEGAITDAMTDAANYLPYIKAFDKNYEVAVVSDALTVRESEMAKKNQVHTAAEKMTADGVFSAGGDVTAVCPACNEEVTWKEMNAFVAAQGNNKITEKGHFYLGADATLASHYTTTVGFCLHLNGHNITSSGRVVYAEYCTVNIMGEGTVTGSHINTARPHFASVIDACGDINLYGGTYKSTVAAPIVSSRSNEQNAVNLYEGASIIRDAANPGLCVRLHDEGDFNMYGGTISGGSTSDGIGGNVLITTSGSTHYPTFTIYGGLLEKGTATQGGNIYTNDKTAIVNIYGGTITEGDVYIGATAKSVTVEGAPVVSNLDLSSGKKLILGDLDGADITVTAPDGAFTEVSSAAAYYVDFFKAAASGKAVKAENNTLVIADA